MRPEQTEALEVEPEDNRSLIQTNSPGNKISMWVVYLCPCVYLIMILIMSICLVTATGISEYDLTRSSIDVLQNFYANQALVPIENIQLIANTSTNATEITCPDGYEEKSAYTFPGIESGCLCEDGSTHTSAYCLVVTSNGCQSVTSYKSKDLYEFDAALVCTQTYADSEISTTDSGSCSDGFTYCNSGYCVKSGLSCPINSLSTTQGDSTEYITLGISKYYITRNTSAEPVVDFSATISNPTCLNPSVYPSTLSGEYYPYWSTPLTGCDDFGDSTNWTDTFGSESQKSYFTDNSLYTYLSELPYWSTYQNTSDLFKLRAVRRISSQKSTECSTLKDNLVEITNSSEDTIELLVDYSIANLILSIVGILFCLGYYFGKNIKIYHRLICYYPIVMEILLLLCFVVMILCFIMAGNYWDNETAIDEDVSALDTVNSAISEGCFDEPGLNLALENLQNYLEISDSWVFGAVVFLFAWSIIFGVIFVACYIYRKYILGDEVLRKP